VNERQTVFYIGSDFIQIHSGQAGKLAGADIITCEQNLIQNLSISILIIITLAIKLPHWKFLKSIIIEFYPFR